MKFFFSSFVNSLYNITWLKEKKDKTSQAFGYFFLLILLLTIISALPIAWKMVSKAKEFGPKFNQNVPDFTATMKSGQLFVSSLKQPYTHAFNIEKSEFLVIVDTESTSSLAIKDLLTKPEQSGVLITKDKVEFYDSQNLETKTNYFQKIPDGATTKAEMVEIVNRFTSGWFVSLFIVILTIFLYIGLAASKLFSVVFVSCVVWVSAAVAKKGWKYGQVLTVCLYGLTLPTIVSLLVTLVYPVAYVYTIVFLAFILAVVFTNSANDPKVETSEQKPV